MSIELNHPRTLAYSSNVAEKFVLLECDAEVLKEILSAGAVIKAPTPEDEAVLCTAEKTYQIKTVGTSNLLLLVPPESLADEAGSVDEDGMISQPGMEDGLQTQMVKNRLLSKGHSKVVVEARASKYLEVMETAPRFDQLESMLAERPIGSDVDRRLSAEASTSGLYSFETVLARVQASEAQLRTAIKTLKAVELDGHVRSLAPTLTLELIELLVLTCRELGVPLTGFPYDDVIQALQMQGMDEAGYREELFDHCIKAFGRATGEGVYCLEAEAVCLQIALKLLRAEPTQTVSAFVKRWRDACPEELAPSLSFLRGHALFEPNARGEEMIRYFSTLDLPRDPGARFRAIFAARERWTIEELDPYLEGIQAVGQSKEGLLLKFTRATQMKPTDPLTFSIRYDFQ